MSEGENAAVLADAQFGIVRILRPYPTFADDYQGVAADTPIMVTEKSRPIDPIAARGTAGYAPNLVRGLQVPLGCRLVIWLPVISIAGAAADTPYKWSFWWRYRNVFDHRQTQQPFHYPKQGVGAPDTSGATPAPRVVIPACNQTIIYVQAEPLTALTRVTQNLRSEDLNVGTVNLKLPLVPGGGTGALQQGILDPATSPIVADQPGWQVHEISGTGDELLIGVSRDTALEATWDFATADANFNALLGSGSGQEFPDIGVYVTAGAAP